LKGKSLLLQKIEHGDFDYSDFRMQALDELTMCEKQKSKLASTWKASQNSLEYKQDEIDHKYIKRHNKLMEDHDREENKMLFELKQSLMKEFGVDLWDETLIEVADGNLVDFYYTYRQLTSIYNGKSKCRDFSQASI